MIKQCKGKDIDKIPVSKLVEGDYYVSKKYDGNYVQIHKIGDTVRFFTSGGKEFSLPFLVTMTQLQEPKRDFIVEAEFVVGEGKLGDRKKSAILTTYRTEFKKGIPSKLLPETNFYIFDILMFKDRQIGKGFDVRQDSITFDERLKILNQLNFSSFMPVVNFKLMTLKEAKKEAEKLCNEGWEGVYLKHKYHKYLPGKRVNTALKIKMKPTADLRCIDVEYGEGKYKGMIGSLVLQDDEGRIVKVGSGLTDELRSIDFDYFLDRIIEIEYEQIADTYLQPVFKCIRFDK